MEEELNYLSEKLEEIEHCLNLVEYGIPLGMNTKVDLLEINNKKEIIENIMNYIVEKELNK